MLSVLTTAGLSAGEVGYSVDDLAPKDWVVEVQSNWPPIALPGCLTIRFPWHSAEDVAAATTKGQEALPVITLHPGMAFGTGEHATTQLCCAAQGAPRRVCAEYGHPRLRRREWHPLVRGARVWRGVRGGRGDRCGGAARRASTPRRTASPRASPPLRPRRRPRARRRTRWWWPTSPARSDARGAGRAHRVARRAGRRAGPVVLGVWGEYQVERVSEAYAAQGFGSIDVDYAEGGWAILQARGRISERAT